MCAGYFWKLLKFKSTLARLIWLKSRQIRKSYHQCGYHLLGHRFRGDRQYEREQTSGLLRGMHLHSACVLPALACWNHNRLSCKGLEPTRRFVKNQAAVALESWIVKLVVSNRSKCNEHTGKPCQSIASQPSVIEYPRGVSRLFSNQCQHLLRKSPTVLSREQRARVQKYETRGGNRPAPDREDS